MVMTIMITMHATVIPLIERFPAATEAVAGFITIGAGELGGGEAGCGGLWLTAWTGGATGVAGVTGFTTGVFPTGNTST